MRYPSLTSITGGRSPVFVVARWLARAGGAAVLAAALVAGPLSGVEPVQAQNAPIGPSAAPQPEKVTQSLCASGAVSVTQPQGYVTFPGMLLNFTAPASGKVVLHFSADLSVTAGGEARLAYLLDGANTYEGEFGPSNFASAQDFAETRTTLAVFAVAPGPHTIEVRWRVSSVNPAATATANRRCAILEIPTGLEHPPAAVCFDPVFSVPITPASGIVPLPGLSTTVNAFATGNAVVRLATDLFTPPGSEVRLLFKVDGGAPQEAVFGPANLANYQEFWETRNTVAVIPLAGTGSHTITAYWRLSGPPTDTAIFQRGCMVVEAPTNAGSATVTDCHTSLTGLTPAGGQQALPGLSAAVTMPAAGNAIVHLAADMGVSAGAEVRVAYSVDGGPAVEYAFGPANLVNQQDYWETRGTVAVIPLSAGAHTITPFWRVSGAAGASGTFQRGCLAVSPTTVAGGKNLRITTGSIDLAWDGGNAQTAYTLLKYNTGTATASLIPLAAAATSYSDPAVVNGTVYCYVLAPTVQNLGALGLSDLECAMPGMEAGTVIAGSFTLALNQSANATMTWTAPVGGADSYLLQRIPLDGSPITNVALGGGVVTSVQAVTAAGTCFQLIGFKGAGFGTTDVLCGIPGVGTLSAGGPSGKTAADAMAEVAERLQGLNAPMALDPTN